MTVIFQTNHGEKTCKVFIITIFKNNRFEKMF